jgi:uncharacterized membrane protein (DUF2068 family)
LTFVLNRRAATMTYQKSSKVLWLVAAFKLLEGLLILVLAVGALKLLHHDVAGIVADWITALRIDPHDEHIHWLLAKLGVLDDQRLKQISAGSFVYAALRLTEGVGLLCRQRWAEYLIVIATGLLIPLEVHEILRHVSVPRITVFAINVAVMWYLVANLRRTRNQAASP